MRFLTASWLMCDPGNSDAAEEALARVPGMTIPVCTMAWCFECGATVAATCQVVPHEGVRTETRCHD
jgi:hypothetical protein